MTWDTLWTLLELQVIAVVLIDMSGFMDWLKARLGKWLGVKGTISLKPLDCSLCMYHWTALIWLVASGRVTLLAYMTVCLLAIATTVTLRAISSVIYLLQKLTGLWN